jgi:hypothetical protein
MSREPGGSSAEAADRLLAELGAGLDGCPDVAFEFSVRLRPGRVETRGRFCCWVVGTGPDAFAPVARVLERLGAPEPVRTAQRDAERPERQGIAVALTAEGPELRLYLHGRDRATLADRYEAWRWRPGAEARRSRYAFHFLPETPSGLRPLESVPPLLRPAFSELLAEERLIQSSGFWLREAEDGTLEQVDLAFPWCPRAVSLHGVRELARVLGVADDERWRELPVRHVAVPAGDAAPSVTLYALASRKGPWPRNEAELQEWVLREARSFHQDAEALLSRLPAPPETAASEDALDRFYGGDLPTWRRVLGPELHYHAGLFETRELEVDDATMEAALRRAVTELYPFIPRGGRLYDVGCGWGGPLAMWIRDLGCPSLGLTISRTQFRHIASRGLPVRWGDAERTLPPGHFDCAVLLESLSHIRDKARLLRVLRPFADRLVMRVNCQDGSPPASAFGGTMHMVSSERLRELLVDSGWHIRHWRDRRLEAVPSVAAWHRRLAAVPEGEDRHIETLRHWCARVLEAPWDWARHNPLIEVVAE